MATKREIEFIFCFSYHHYATDGKLQNTLDFLEATRSQAVCLNVSSPQYDKPSLSLAEIQERLARIPKVTAALRKKEISTHLIFPGISIAHRQAANTCRQDLFQIAVKSRIKTIWLDDSKGQCFSALPPRKILDQTRSLRRAADSADKSISVGLIAGSPDDYYRMDVSAGQIAKILSGKRMGLVAQSQSYSNDSNRADIIKSVQTLATAVAVNSPDAKLIGYIENQPTGGFHKSTEATQMQINLNLLHGVNTILINCFDDAGTAPGIKNLYLRMIEENQPFVNQLAKLLPSSDRPNGVRIPVPGKSHSDSMVSSSTIPNSLQNDWPSVLTRLGIPVCIESTSDVGDDDNDNDKVYLLNGLAASHLTKKQLKHIFHQGVLLDAEAARIIQDMECSSLLGVRLGGRLKDVQAEIFSDQGFACPYYGYRTPWGHTATAKHFYQLTPTHSNTQKITTLLTQNAIPNKTGMTLFDDTDHNHRCAITPYSGRLFNENSDSCMLLSIERQRHFYELFCWLRRRRLSCFVENAPDLIPFYIPLAGKRRIILALLNISFDWAIHARIRLGTLPFTIKRIHSLEEDGHIDSRPQLKTIKANDYQYIRLTPETAVPPMQMMVLILEQ